jgi:hypothetical protein
LGICTNGGKGRISFSNSTKRTLELCLRSPAKNKTSLLQNLSLLDTTQNQPIKRLCRNSRLKPNLRTSNYMLNLQQKLHAKLGKTETNTLAQLWKSRTWPMKKLC